MSNRFDKLAPVRLEVRTSRDEVREVRYESAWPLAGTDFRKLYLSGDQLVPEQKEKEGEVFYGMEGSAAFDITFPEDTELSGPMALRLWVEARAVDGTVPDDAILCCFLDKRDRQGRSVRFNGSVGTTDDMVTRGYIRVSRRALDAVRSTSWRPVARGDSVEKLAPGDIVPVDIALCPTSTFFAAGEGLRLIVSPTEIVHAPIFGKDTSLNAGRHVLHFGGKFDSHLIVPVIPADRDSTSS